MSKHEVLTSLFWLVVIGYFTYLVMFARASVRDRRGQDPESTVAMDRSESDGTDIPTVHRGRTRKSGAGAGI